MKSIADNSTKQKRFGVIIVIIALFSLALPFILGLVSSGINGEDLSVTFKDFYRYFVLAGIIFIMLYTLECFIYYRRKDLMHNYKQLGVILADILLTYIFAIIFGRFISYYCMPLLLSGLIIAMLIEKRLAIFANIMINIAFFLCIVTLFPEEAFLPAIFSIVTQSIVGSLLIIMNKKYYTRMSFLTTGLLIGIFIAMPLAILCSLLTPSIGWRDVLLSGVWAFVSMLLGLALFMISLPVLETIFSLYSDFRLEEMCSPETKLMKKLAQEAPGTYNHSLAVGNLAQACAMRINENPALAKAAAYYHDIGKLKSPICFTENQTDYNPHDDFIPEVSVHKITEHSTYGAELIKKYNLPDAIAKIAIEHHGTTPVQYFLNKAKGITEEQLAREKFCYPGPKPSTKISAIIMIVDTVEAATRAQGVDKDEKNFREFIHGLITAKVNSEQFTDCPITFKDIQNIEDCLVAMIPSLYHQRIKYSQPK